MKKSLQKRIRAYSLTAGAVIAAGTTEGQVIYTDINPDITRTNNGDFYDLDLNNDATVDFRIYLNKGSSSFTSTYFSSFYSYKTIAINPQSSNSVAYYSGFLANALNSGVAVDNAVGSWDSNDALMAREYFSSAYGGVYTSSSIYGAWTNATDKYLGLRFKISGQTHYGWARLDVDINTPAFTIKDYAYNAAVNQPAITGYVPADVAQAVSGSDVADNSNGSDLQIDFNKASFEASVQEYRIMVVKSAAAGGFDLAAAQAVASGNYTAIAPTGSNISTVPGAAATDTDGDLITIAAPYRIFVLSIADGVNALNDSLSAPSANVTLNTRARTASNLNAEDIANNLDAGDMQISFTKAVNESGIAEYRAIVVKAVDATSFDLPAAQAVAGGNYTTVLPSGSDIQQTLSNGATDKDGDPIAQNVAYRFFVLSVADGSNANLDSLSAASGEITLTPYTGLTELDEAVVNVYANRQKIIVDLGDLHFKQGQVKISDMSGKSLGSYGLQQPKTIIDLEAEEGLYLITIEADRQLISKKILLRR